MSKNDPDACGAQVLLQTYAEMARYSQKKSAAAEDVEKPRRRRPPVVFEDHATFHTDSPEPRRGGLVISGQTSRSRNDSEEESRLSGEGFDDETSPTYVLLSDNAWRSEAMKIAEAGLSGDGFGDDDWDDDEADLRVVRSGDRLMGESSVVEAEAEAEMERLLDAEAAADRAAMSAMNSGIEDEIPGMESEFDSPFLGKL